MIMLLTGPDTYRSRQRLRVLKEGFRTKYDPSGTNISTIDGSSCSADDIRSAVGTGGLLSAKRLVIVERLGDNPSREMQKAVAEYIQTIAADDTIVIFHEKEKQSKTGRAKKTKPVFSFPGLKVERFEELTRPQLNRWVSEEAKRLGGTISPDARDMLIASTEGDVWRLSAELGKVIAYAGKRTATKPDVDVLVRSAYDTEIFHLVDAVSEQRSRDALRLIDDQLASGSSPQYVLAMLLRQVRLLLRVRDMLDRDGSTRAAQGIHPYVLRKVTTQSKHFTLSNLKHLHARLVAIDEQLKTGSEDARAVMQLFILEATGVAT